MKDEDKKQKIKVLSSTVCSSSFRALVLWCQKQLHTPPRAPAVGDLFSTKAKTNTVTSPDLHQKRPDASSSLAKPKIYWLVHHSARKRKHRICFRAEPYLVDTNHRLLVASSVRCPLIIHTRLYIHLQVHGRGWPPAVVHEAADLGRPDELARRALLEAVHVVRAHALVCDQHLRAAR